MIIEGTEKFPLSYCKLQRNWKGMNGDIDSRLCLMETRHVSLIYKYIFTDIL